MSQKPHTTKTTTVAGTNAANQQVTHTLPFIKALDLIVTVTTNLGVVSTLSASGGYTVSGTASAGIFTGGTITVTNAVPTTSTITISSIYPPGTSNDILRRWVDRGTPIDGEFANDDVVKPALLTTQRRTFTQKEPSTLANP